MPYLMDVGGPEYRSVSKDLLPDKLDDAVRRLSSPEPLTEAERQLLPTTISISKPARGGVPHVLGWRGSPYIVSPQVRNLIDLLAPSNFDFIPIFVISHNQIPIKGRIKHGEYYIIRGFTQIDCVVPELTYFRKGYGVQGLEKTGPFAPLSDVEDEICTLRKDVIIDQHFWRGHGIYSFYFFCSDYFREQFKQAKFDGFVFEKKCALT